jgi:uncharacterized protein (DUF1778 family)
MLTTCVFNTRFVCTFLPGCRALRKDTGVTGDMRQASLSVTLSWLDAESIRQKAAGTHHSVNQYVLGSVRKQVPFDNRLYQAGKHLGVSKALHSHWHRPIAGPRTALHLRCSESEACRIKRAANRRRTTVSEYIVGCLKGSWGLPGPFKVTRSNLIA